MDGPDHPQGDIAQDALTIARLATLNLFEFDRVRKAEADRLGIRTETLDAQVRKAREVPRPSDDGEPRPPEFTDEALALRYADLYEDRVRYVAQWGRWLIYDGSVWRSDDTLQAFGLSRTICRSASAACHDQVAARTIASARTVAAVERLAKADRRLAATVEQWDTDPWALNTPAGIVNLRTGQLRPHKATDYCTKITAVPPGDDCPLWRAFLKTVTGGDMQLQLFLQRMVGYALTGSTREHALFFCYGQGGNGKGVFLNTITGILAEFATIASMETFTATQNDRHPTDLAMLRGARLVTTQETEDGHRWAEARIKAMTGGDPITARFMRADFFTFVPTFKLIVAGNHRPGLRNVDEAIRRRFNLVPFSVTIDPAMRDPDLPDKLRDEWPGILQWAIDGCMLWQEHGLAPPAAVLDATASYMEAEDALALWIAECCDVDPKFCDSSSALFVSWKAWAERAGEFPGSQKRFSQSMAPRGFQASRGATGRATFNGVRLKPSSNTRYPDN